MGTSRSQPDTPLVFGLTFPHGASLRHVEHFYRDPRQEDGMNRWKTDSGPWALTAVVRPDGVFRCEVVRPMAQRPVLLGGDLPIEHAPFGSHGPAAILLDAVREHGQPDTWPIPKVKPCRVCESNGILASRRNTDERPVCAARCVTACVDCGMPDPAHYLGGTRERMLAESRCFTCDHWRQVAADGRTSWRPGRRVITPDFHLYTIGNGRGPKDCKGFAGAPWVIEWMDGSEPTRTDDLWSGGVVPAHLRHLFTPNAVARSGREVRA